MTIGSLLDFQGAQHITSKNKNRIFMKQGGNGTSGFERSTADIFPRIVVTPKFQIDRAGKVFTIGSCFARNIERVLTRFGIDCITSRCIFPDALYEQTGIGARNGALNAYTVHSMLDIVRLPSRPDREYAGALRLGDDEWCDMMVSGLRFISTEELRQIRSKLIDVYGAMREADTVIITLGYTESWYDTEDRIFVNRSPGSSVRTARKGNRYQFMNASGPQASEALRQLLSEIHTVTEGRARVIVTTSPVPLHATFTGQDVIVANQYSKCTLLSSAALVASEHDWVDYYPSYEMVINSDRSWAWHDDGVHVRNEVVDRVIETFSNAYFAVDVAEPASMSAA
jgi:hypothetical protein